MQPDIRNPPSLDVGRFKTFLFKNQPFPQCHGSTLARFSDGNLAVAWFAGTRERHPDTAIWWCREKDGKWTKPEVLAKVNDEAHWNPVLYQDPYGAMWVYFKTGGFPDRWDTWRSKFSFTTGWGTPKKLGSKMLECGRMTPGPVRGKMVRLSSGTVIAPSSIEKIVSKTFPHSVVKWESVMHRSSNGKKWTSFMIPFDRTVYGEFGGIIQPSVWETAPGKVSALFRSTCGLLFRSDSVDDGMTWSGVVPTGIPNPNSAVDVAVKGNVVALAFNPVSGNWVGRSPISVAFSGMSGTAFGSVVHVESGAGSFSYPAIIETDNGFAMTYTWNRTNIAFAYVDVVSVDVEGELGNTVPIVKTELRGGPEQYDFKQEPSIATRYDGKRKIKDGDRGQGGIRQDRRGGGGECVHSGVGNQGRSWQVPVGMAGRKGKDENKRIMGMSVDGVKDLLYNLKRRLCSRTLRETLSSGEPQRGVAAEPTVSANSLGIRRRRFGSEEIGVMGTRLFVGNISFKATEDTLRELFEQQGQVKDCHIVMDRETQRSKGFAFVEMSTQEEATAAIEKFDKYDFEGRPLNVSEARPKTERPR